MKIATSFIVLAYFTLRVYSAAIAYDTTSEHVSLLSREKRFDEEARQSDDKEIDPLNEEEDTKADKGGKGKPPKVKPTPAPHPPKKTTTTPPPPPPVKPTPPPPPPPTKKPVDPHVFPNKKPPPPPPPPANPYSIVDPTNPAFHPEPVPHSPYQNPFSPYGPAPAPYSAPPQEFGNGFYSPAPQPNYPEPAEFEPSENSYRQSHSKARSEEENIQVGAAYVSPPPANYAPKPVYAPTSYTPPPTSYAPVSYAPPAYSPVQCPQNLLVSCQPNVQTAPCSAYNSYPAAPPAYHPAPASAYPAKPAYRFASDQQVNEFEGFVSHPQSVNDQHFTHQQQSLSPNFGQFHSNQAQMLQQMPDTHRNNAFAQQQTPNMAQLMTPTQQMQQMNVPQNSAFTQQQQQQQQQPSMMNQANFFGQQASNLQQFPSNQPQMMRQMPERESQSAVQEQTQTIPQQEFVGQIQQNLNEQNMMVGSPQNEEFMRINFYKDADGGYYTHAGHGHNKQDHGQHCRHGHHGHLCHNKKEDHHKDKKPIIKDDENPDSELDNAAKTPKHHRKHHKKTDIKQEEEEEAIGDAAANVGQQTPNLSQNPLNAPQTEQSPQQTSERVPTPNQATAFSHQHMQQMDAPDLQTQPMQQTVAQSQPSMEMPQNQAFQQQPSMRTHPNFFGQQTSNSQQFASNQPQMMRQIPDTQQNVAFSQQQMRQMNIPQNPAFTQQQQQQQQQPSMMNQANFFGHQASNFQQFPSNQHQMMRQMPGIESQMASQQQTQLMPQQEFVGQQHQDITIPLSHHHRQHLKDYNLWSRHHTNSAPHIRHHTDYDPYSDNSVEPLRPAKKPSQHVHRKPTHMISDNENYYSFGRESSNEDESKEMLGVAMTNEPSTVQQSPNLSQMQPQMMRQMPDANQMQEQTPMMPQQASIQSPEFSQHQMRQMVAPEFQQMQPSQTVPFAHQFQMAPQTQQQMPTHTFRQLQEMTQNFGFEQPNNDQIAQSSPMHQQQQQFDQFVNPHHFVSMPNPMAQQFALEDNTRQYQYY